MKLLLTGCDGQVGWALNRKLSDSDIEVIATNRSNLDLTRRDEIETMFQLHAFDAVVNPAAYTLVDRAESEPDITRAVNTAAPAQLAQLCSLAGIPLIHLSTDYVFGGYSPQPWKETDPTSPLGVYGATKRDGEEAVRATVEHHIILRTSWEFGIHGNNFAKTMLRLASERNEINVVADQWGCPTFAGHIANAIVALLTRLQINQPLPWGTYHFADGPETTWHNFARIIIEHGHKFGIIGNVPTVNAISTAEYPTDAKRPQYSVLDCTKFFTTFTEVEPASWEEGVKQLTVSLSGVKK